MPVGMNSLALQGYFSSLKSLKTVQKSFRFYVTFWDDLFSIDKRKLAKEIGTMPSISFWHINSIVLPQYPFGKDVVKYGPMAKSFPVMNDFNGLDITITFEEDEMGTIANFIHWCQNKIIDRKNGGVYRSQNENRINHLIVETEDDAGVPIQFWWFKNLYFQNAAPLNLDYASTESVKYEITFGADFMQFYPLKSELSPKSLIKNIIGGNI